MTYKEVLPCIGHDKPGSVRLVGFMGSDLSVVQAARVSYDADWRAGEDEGKDAKLIDYLMKNHHTSPFEMVQFRFEVKAPIFVFRQWHRHRTWSFNEMSARYTELDEGYYLPGSGDYGVQSASSKQARDRKELTEAQNRQEVFWRDGQKTVIDQAIEMYRAHLEAGMPRELARIVLPVACYSRMQASIDLHNLFHFLRLRCHAHAQYEIQVYANAMLELIEPIVPVCAASFRKHVLVSS
jgi:thymidylate synthase (FAD)